MSLAENRRAGDVHSDGYCDDREVVVGSELPTPQIASSRFP